MGVKSPLSLVCVLCSVFPVLNILIKIGMKFSIYFGTFSTRAGWQDNVTPACARYSGLNYTGLLIFEREFVRTNFCPVIIVVTNVCRNSCCLVLGG